MPKQLLGSLPLAFELPSVCNHQQLTACTAQVACLHK
jgi:hypothetical protein